VAASTMGGSAGNKVSWSADDGISLARVQAKEVLAKNKTRM